MSFLGDMGSSFGDFIQHVPEGLWQDVNGGWGGLGQMVGSFFGQNESMPGLRILWAPLAAAGGAALAGGAAGGAAGGGAAGGSEVTPEAVAGVAGQGAESGAAADSSAASSSYRPNQMPNFSYHQSNNYTQPQWGNDISGNNYGMALANQMKGLSAPVNFNASGQALAKAMNVNNQPQGGMPA